MGREILGTLVGLGLDNATDLAMASSHMHQMHANELACD
jgi:hypothetical protein